MDTASTLRESCERRGEEISLALSMVLAGVGGACAFDAALADISQGSAQRRQQQLRQMERLPRQDQAQMPEEGRLCIVLSKGKGSRISLFLARGP